MIQFHSARRYNARMSNSDEYYEREREIERLQSKIAAALMGRQLRDGEEPDEEWMATWRKARVMIHADELLEASRFALAVFQSMSTEEFSAGGDHIARKRLLGAIGDATGGDNSVRHLEKEARESIAESSPLNAQNV